MATTTSSAIPSTPVLGAGRAWLAPAGPAVALVVVVVACLWRLDRPLLWGDEADTAVSARGVLQHGCPVEFDGRNLSDFQNGGELNGDLVRIRVSWAQSYVAALSMLLFGEATGGVRLLFAILGVTTFFPLQSLLRGYVRHPHVVAALALLAPQNLLFLRNARYYPLLILTYAVMLRLVSDRCMAARARIILESVVLVLLFQVHSLAALCSCLSLLAFHALFDRGPLLGHALACGVGFASWLGWRTALGPPIVDTPIRFSLITAAPLQWLESFGIGLRSGFQDLDVVGCMPVVLWIAAVAALFRRHGRTVALAVAARPLPALVMINIVIQVTANAALFGSDTDAHYALIRYMPHLAVFAIASCFALLDAAGPHAGVFLAACIAAVATNLFCISYWATPPLRAVPLSWVPGVAAEIIMPETNPWDVTIATLRREADSDRRDRVIATPLEWEVELIIYYLGDYYLTPPPHDAKGRRAVSAIIGERAYARYDARPEWIVDTLGLLRAAPPGYQKIADLPSRRVRPDDGTRPELTRHTFPQPTVVRSGGLWRLRSPSPGLEGS